MKKGRGPFFSNHVTKVEDDPGSRCAASKLTSGPFRLMAAKRFFFITYFLGCFLIEHIFLSFLLVIFLTGTFQEAQPNTPNSSPFRFHQCEKFFFHYLLHCDFFFIRLFHWTLLGLGTFPLLHLSLLSDPFRLTTPNIATVQC